MRKSIVRKIRRDRDINSLYTLYNHHTHKKKIRASPPLSHPPLPQQGGKTHMWQNWLLAHTHEKRRRRKEEEEGGRRRRSEEEEEEEEERGLSQCSPLGTSA